jgi:hypothetical protein
MNGPTLRLYTHLLIGPFGLLDLASDVVQEVFELGENHSWMQLHFFEVLDNIHVVPQVLEGALRELNQYYGNKVLMVVLNVVVDGLTVDRIINPGHVHKTHTLTDDLEPFVADVLPHPDSDRAKHLGHAVGGDKIEE